MVVVSAAISPTLLEARALETSVMGRPAVGPRPGVPAVPATSSTSTGLRDLDHRQAEHHHDRRAENEPSHGYLLFLLEARAVCPVKALTTRKVPCDALVHQNEKTHGITRGFLYGFPWLASPGAIFLLDLGPEGQIGLEGARKHFAVFSGSLSGH